jgi:hypothetical protein
MEFINRGKGVFCKKRSLAPRDECVTPFARNALWNIN